MSIFRRKRRRDTPTSDLVAILSSIAATIPTTYASQPPPDYLCPSVSPLPSQTKSKRKRQTNETDGNGGEGGTSEAVTARGSGSRARSPRSPVVDRYVPGDDGKWHKVADYSWYGHDSCSPSSANPSVSATVQVDTVESSASPPPPNPSFPTGWKTPPDTTRDDLPAIIMALSIALAVLICVVTIGWIFWRRRGKLRKGKEKANDNDNNDDDVEASVGQGERSSSGSVIEQSKQKQKLWAKASARWKSNVRLTVRRRRVQQTLRHSASTLTVALTQDTHSATPSMTLPVDESEAGQMSETLSSQTLTPEEESSDTGSQSSGRQSEEDHQDDNTSQTSSTHSSPDIPSSPPAYNHPPPSRPPSPSSSGSKVPPPPDDSLDTILSVGHIATDDKLILAQRALLVSAPDFDFDPSSAVATSSSSSPHPVPAAPEWMDEQFEDFHNHHLHTSHPASPSTLDHPGALSVNARLDRSTDANSSMQWPSPPTSVPSSSKCQMAVFEHQYAMFPEYTEAEPEMGPSAPPFEERDVYEGRVRAEIGIASAPPIELDEAGAPPLEYAESESKGHASASAPPIAIDQVHDGDDTADDTRQLAHGRTPTPTPIASAPRLENG